MVTANNKQANQTSTRKIIGLLTTKSHHLGTDPPHQLYECLCTHIIVRCTAECVVLESEVGRRGGDKQTIQQLIMRGCSV